MRQQLRLRVILPVAVLGLLGAGFGTFAYGQPPESAPVPPSTTPAATATEAAPASKPKKARKPAPARTPLERELRSHRAAVVVFYTPNADVDNVAVREARAGALAVRAGFLAVNVRSNRAVTKLAQRYGVLESPAVLVVLRRGKLAARFGGYADRETVAQAVTNGLS
jgi:hypothetical protein